MAAPDIRRRLLALALPAFLVGADASGHLEPSEPAPAVTTPANTPVALNAPAEAPATVPPRAESVFSGRCSGRERCGQP